MKSILIIGMGRFGLHLAEKFTELGNEVMVVDQNADIIEELSPRFTDAQIGDCTNEAVLRSLGVGNFDICFVSIGDNFQSSLEITSLLKELGAKYVVSKARREIQAKFLLRNGADEVAYPERDSAEKLAIRHSARTLFDYIELTPEYGIFEIPIPAAWHGKSIAELNIRRRHLVNVLAIKNGDKLLALPSAEYVFVGPEHAIVLGKVEDVFRLNEKP